MGHNHFLLYLHLLGICFLQESPGVMINMREFLQSFLVNLLSVTFGSIFFEHTLISLTWRSIDLLSSPSIVISCSNFLTAFESLFQTQLIPKNDAGTNEGITFFVWLTLATGCFWVNSGKFKEFSLWSSKDSN